MDISKFWKRVNKEIKTHRLSRKKFADSIGISHNTFKSWLYYKRSVEVGTAYEIAAALGVSLEYLITGKNGRKGYLQSRKDLRPCDIRKLTGPH